MAERLGNTPSICRKCYVHPAVIDAYPDGTIVHALREHARRELTGDMHALRPEEVAVLGLLQQRPGTVMPQAMTATAPAFARACRQRGTRTAARTASHPQR